ncbi:MAG: FAD binding domain-containing protein [Deltaproteobacteria bacterium]|nr:MAG: FAD binding domain-containing protein [Deltaproteobacteria bacterium]
MSQPRFKYLVAKSPEELATLLTRYGGKAKVLAGGTDLLGAMKDRVTVPEVIINIKKIEELDYIREADGTLKIGALTKLNDIEKSPIIRDRYSMLSEAARSIGSPMIRNMGTIGGNLCQDVRCWYYRASPWCGTAFICYRKGGDTCYVTGHSQHKGMLSVEESDFKADELFLYGGGVRVVNPAFALGSLEITPEVAGDGRYHSIMGTKVCHAVCPSDMATVLMALGAKVRVMGCDGERMLSVEELWLSDAPWLAIESDEIISEIQIPAFKGETVGTYLKLRFRKAVDFSIVSVAALLVREGSVVKSANIILGGVAPIPWRAKESEAILKDTSMVGMADMVGEAASIEASPLAMSAYKVPLSKVAVKQAILNLELETMGHMSKSN